MMTKVLAYNGPRAVLEALGRHHFRSPEEKGGVITLFTGFDGFPDIYILKLNEVFTIHGILGVRFFMMLPGVTLPIM